MKGMIIALIVAFVAGYALFTGSIPGVSLGGIDLSHMLHTQFGAVNPEFMEEVSLCVHLPGVHGLIPLTGWAASTSRMGHSTQASARGLHTWPSA